MIGGYGEVGTENIWYISPPWNLRFKDSLDIVPMWNEPELQLNLSGVELAWIEWVDSYQPQWSDGKFAIIQLNVHTLFPFRNGSPLTWK